MLLSTFKCQLCLSFAISVASFLMNWVRKWGWKLGKSSIHSHWLKEQRAYIRILGLQNTSERPGFVNLCVYTEQEGPQMNRIHDSFEANVEHCVSTWIIPCIAWEPPSNNINSLAAQMRSFVNHELTQHIAMQICYFYLEDTLLFNLWVPFLGLLLVRNLLAAYLQNTMRCLQ